MDPRDPVALGLVWPFLEGADSDLKLLFGQGIVRRDIGHINPMRSRVNAVWGDCEMLCRRLIRRLPSGNIPTAFEASDIVDVVRSRLVVESRARKLKMRRECGTKGR